MRWVRKWMEDEDFILTVIPDATADLKFGVKFRPDDTRYAEVMFPRRSSDVINITSGWKLSEEHDAAYRKLTQQEKEQFVTDLRMSLLPFMAAFDAPVEPAPDHFVKLWRNIYFDGLSKTVFMEAMADVYSALTLALWKISARLGSPALSEKEGMIGWRT